MALTEQTSQLFARVFGRSPESASETSFLKGVESRKGVGTPAALGAIQFAQKQGSFGSPQGSPQGAQGPQVEEDDFDSMLSGIDTFRSKLKEIDEKEKKLFREEQKLEVKKHILSDPGFKALLETRTDLRGQLKEKDFGADIPVTPGITDPTSVARAAIGQQEGIADFVSTAGTLAEGTDESIGGILDKLGTQRQNDYNNARQSLSDLISLRQEERAEEKHGFDMQKLQLDISNSASGMTPEERARLALDVAETFGVSVDEANEIVDKFAGGFTPGSNGMRTDRHNNPAAFTTDIARQAGLVVGVDYIPGDPFPDNANLRTAKILGDPIDTTIKVIDKIGFYTQGGKPRWSYLSAIPQHKNWSKMSREQKKEVIAQMYEREGGSGSLLYGGQPVVTGIVEETPTPTSPASGLRFENPPGLKPISGGIPSFTIQGGGSSTGQTLKDQAQKYIK